MAYVQIEADERIEEGPERLQFHSCLDSGNDSNASRGGGSPGFRDANTKSAFWNLEYYQPYFDVDTPTAETAFALVYAYGLGWPALIWVALRYYGLEEWSMVEAIAVWGYGQFVWIPASLICIAPFSMLRWALTGVGFAISGYFICANVYPILQSADSRVSRVFIIPIVLSHVIVAFLFKVMFFSYYVVKVGTPDPVPSDTGSPDTPAAMLF